MSSLLRSFRVLQIFLATVLLWLSGCASVSVPEAPLRDSQSGLILRADRQLISDPALYWPAPPETPRYRYVGQLLGEQNFPAKPQSTMGRFFRWLVGLGSHKLQPRVLQRPQNGFVADDGRIYVTDVSRGAVYVFDGQQDNPEAGLQVWEYADTKTRFVTPVGIAAGVADTILVADAELACVVQLSRAGENQQMICHPDLLRPTGLARDADQGLIYVVDSKSHDIKVFNDAGQWVRTLGQRGEGAGQFNGPTYLSMSQGLLYVSDTLNARVQVIDTRGNFVRSYGRRGLYLGDTPRPKGVATDNDGNLYVVESYYDYLLIFNNKGDFLLPIGGTGNDIGQFFLPAGVWVRDDRVYVADTFNGRIMIFQYLGNA